MKYLAHLSPSHWFGKGVREGLLLIEERESHNV